MAEKKRIQLNKIFKHLKKDMADPFYQNIASGLAYYFLLSIVPIFLILGQLADTFLQTREELIITLQEYAPEQLTEVIMPILSQQVTTGGTIATMSLSVIMLFLASRGMYALIKVCDYAYEIAPPNVKYSAGARLLFQRIKSIFMTLVLTLLVIVALFFVGFGKTILAYLVNFSDPESKVWLLHQIWSFLQFPVAFIFLFVILFVFYYGLPSRRVPAKKVIPGALFATVGIAIATFGYVIYVTYFWRYNFIYGALSSIVILMLWFFILAYTLEFGILLNRAVQTSKLPGS